jgi:hypothetical protein
MIESDKFNSALNSAIQTTIHTSSMDVECNTLAA